MSDVVDPTAEPKTIEISFTDGPQAGKVSKGIYEIEKDWDSFEQQRKQYAQKKYGETP